MKNNNKYCNKNKSAWIAYCNNILSKLMHGFATGYNSAFGCVKRFTLKFCCIKIKSLLPTLNHHGHTLIPSWRCSYIACATDKTKFWLSLSCFGFCTRIWVCAMIGLVVTNAIVNICISRWKEIQNALLVICWACWVTRTSILALLRRCY